MSQKYINMFYCAWHKCVKRVLNIPAQTHCVFQPHLYGSSSIAVQTRQSEMADLARRATRDLSQFHMGGPNFRHRSILETITHRPKCQIQKL